MIANWHIDIDFSTLRQPFSADSLGLVSVSDNTNYIYDVTCMYCSLYYVLSDGYYFSLFCYTKLPTYNLFNMYYSYSSFHQRFFLDM